MKREAPDGRPKESLSCHRAVPGDLDHLERHGRTAEDRARESGLPTAAGGRTCRESRWRAYTCIPQSSGRTRRDRNRAGRAKSGTKQPATRSRTRRRRFGGGRPIACRRDKKSAARPNRHSARPRIDFVGRRPVGRPDIEGLPGLARRRQPADRTSAADSWRKTLLRRIWLAEPRSQIAQPRDHLEGERLNPVARKPDHALMGQRRRSGLRADIPDRRELSDHRHAARPQQDIEGCQRRSLWLGFPDKRSEHSRLLHFA